MDETGFDCAPIAQIVIDDQNRVTGINQAARTLFSLRQHDVGRPLHDLELSRRTGELRSLIADVRKTQRTLVRSDVTWQPQSAEPRTLAVQIDPLTLPRTEFTGAIVTCTDVTEQRALQIELQQARRELTIAYEELKATVDALETTSDELRSTNEALETMNDELRERTSETLQADSVLAAVLSGIPQGVVVVDDRLRVIVWSRRATDLWGLSDDEAEGEHLLNLDSGISVERLRDPIRRVLAGGKEAEIELDGHDRRGKAVHVKIGIAPLESLPGIDEPFGAILLVSAERPG